MAGATAPSTIAGAITQAVAECLAGLVYVNAVKPGHTAIFGTWPFGLDLRTGAMSVGSGTVGLGKVLSLSLKGEWMLLEQVLRTLDKGNPDVSQREEVRHCYSIWQQNA